MAYLLQILVVVISLRIKLGANKQITQLALYTMIGPKQKNVFYQYVDALGQFKYISVLLPRRLASGPKIIQIMNTKEKQKSLWKTNSRLGTRRKFKVKKIQGWCDVDVDLRLFVLKPIHATWIVSRYNQLSSSEGRQSIAKGWKKAGVTDVVSGSKKLPPEDPFEDLDV